MFLEQTYWRSILSRFGTILLVWRPVTGDPKETGAPAAPGGPKVAAIILPGEGVEAKKVLQEMFPEARRGSHPIVDRLAQQIGRFLEGQPVRFSLDLLELERCPPFQRRVLPAEFRIPRGWVTTYGRLAAHIGAPGAARAVGNALARNPFPVVIPCHRCIREDGRLGGFRGGLAMKRALLEMEGVRLESGRRIPRRFFWNI
jgi:methylated-DNA-[protein]-cysteine S-methyltransferase